MRKLRLDLDDLTVQTFTTDAAHGPRGTARAHQVLPSPDDPTIAPGDTEPGMNCLTCELSCGTRGC